MSEDRSAPQGSPGGVRASDEDREQLVSELREHAVAGRLTTEELEDRVQAVYSARTTAELDAVRHDLPVTGHQLAINHAARRSHLTRRMLQESGGSLGLFVVCAVIWLGSGAHGQFWPVWVLLVFALSMVRNGWALFGPAPDLDAVEQSLDARREQRLARHQRREQRQDQRSRRLNR